ATMRCRPFTSRRLRRSSDDIVAIRERDRLCAAAHTELSQDVLDVRPDGLATYVELLRDLVLLVSFGEQAENLHFAPRQLGRHPGDDRDRTGIQSPNSGEELVGRDRLREVI